MAIREFTYCADKEATGTASFRVRSASFGDGYTQKAGDGINGKRQTWPLSFTKKKAEAEAIKQFFDDHKGYQSFAWKPPLEPLGLYQVEEYTLLPLGAGMYRISATFTESFHP
ncbi:minor tail protein [Vibrio phage VaK]|uniref:Phage tail protein n=1 Tax=Vibrio anguillarum TaxID=55601 RepID=A0AAW4B956_VIBAN|nr:minor tail protein [Vibrio phage VaK]MBF4433193.1 phage tail protein [Vibrio anguillarum]